MIEYLSKPFAFIMPHRNTGSLRNLALLKNSISNIFRQTDNKWLLIIIDESTDENSKLYLRDLSNKNPDKVLVHFHSQRKGPAYCKNLAIRIAAEYEIPVLLFNDSDDISHIKRVEVTREYFTKYKCDTVLYSTFLPVDDKGSILEAEQITPSIAEIVEVHKSQPLQGYDIWKDIGTKTGYTNLTSATSVCTELAIKFPFPDEEVSEDSHTWMRYSAGGGRFVFAKEIPVKYRTTIGGFGSSTRDSQKGRFYQEKARVDEDGFKESIKIALSRNRIKEKDIQNLLIGFYIRLSETMIKEKAFSLANKLICKSLKISKMLTHNELRKNRIVSNYYFCGYKYK